MSTPTLLDRAAAIAAAFTPGAPAAAAARHGNGHIHDSFAVTLAPSAGRRRILLQRLNTRVFPDVESMQENIVRVTSHLRRRLAAAGENRDGRRVLTPVPACGGGWLVRDDEGGVWRAYDFVERCFAIESVATPEQARLAAHAFAGFQRLLADYDGPPLRETLPEFHDTPARLRRLDLAVAADACGRVAAARAEIQAVAAQRVLADSLLALRRAGRLPERIVHNDTKINNLLLDDATGQALCVVDLDTVMPGLALYDFGDLVRTTAAERPEDEPDVAAVHARPDFVVAAAAGWIEGAAETLLPVEREHLVIAARLLSFECGVRFLTDYLQGDTYFRIHRPHQNLDRCRTQLALERSLAAQQGTLEARIRAL